jgi:hypothetical protein
MSITQLLTVVQYSWWAYEWVYKPLVRAPVQIVIPFGNYSQKATTISRDDVLANEIQQLKFDLMQMKEDHFAIVRRGRPREKTKRRPKRRHSI